MGRRTSRHLLPTDPVTCVVLVAELKTATLVVDVEPFVTTWDSPATAFAERVEALHLAVALGAPSVSALVLASNARRVWRLPALGSWPRTVVESFARKPWRTGYLEGLPVPITVIGDQILTDGLLAWRLNATFVHCPSTAQMPLLPRVQTLAARPLTRLLFLNRSTGR